MITTNNPIPLSPFQKHFFYREKTEFSSTIYVSIELDQPLCLSLEKFKSDIIIPLLANEPVLRTRIKYNENGDPVMQHHSVDEFIQKGLIDDMVEETDLKIDSKTFLKKYTASPFAVNKDIQSMNEKNWKFVVNYEQNFISFVFSHVLLDGISGVSVLNSCLALLNGQKLFSSIEMSLTGNSCGFVQAYPINKKLVSMSPLEDSNPSVPLFTIPNVFIKPKAHNDGCRLLFIQDSESLKDLIKKCKLNKVALNSYIIAMLAISTFHGEPLKCKFIVPVDLRERLQIDEQFIPKATLGLLITFIQVITPVITKKETIKDSEEYWIFVKKIHQRVLNAIPKAVEDLTDFGNMAVVDQSSFWKSKKSKYEQRHFGKETPDTPTHTFALSNLSFNFKHNPEYHFNVSRSVFSQCKRPVDYVSCSMISTSQSLSISFLHCDDDNGILENWYHRFENSIKESDI